MDEVGALEAPGVPEALAEALLEAEAPLLLDDARASCSWPPREH